MTGLRRPRLPGLGLWLILCVPPLIAFDGRSGMRWWATAAAFPLLAVAVLVRRRLPLVSVALPVLASLAVSRDLFTVAYCLPMAVFGALAGVRMPRARPALWTFTALAATGLPLSALADRTIWPWFSALLTPLLLVVLPWLLGRYRRQYGELVRTGRQLAARRECEQRAVADGARLRKRTRIAGDMHGPLGHDLALIALRARALEVDSGLDPRRRTAAGDHRRPAHRRRERATGTGRRERDRAGADRTVRGTPGHHGGQRPPPGRSRAGSELGGTLHAGPAPEGGFTASASLPTVIGAPPPPPKRHEPTTFQGELAQAQHRVRRRLRQTVPLPLAPPAALVAPMGVSRLAIPSRTVLDRARYDGLRIGTPRTEADKSLPFFALDAPPDGTPPPPHGWSCTYYSTGTRTAAAYELRFAGGRLAGKALVRRAQP
ncbi:hypothetical protein [Streptomyces chattanoogensis]|uniref:histidine kinase n=1 Tax=Streptomyces chattanoogensis TaxID=66876 RepID=A0A0N0H4D6_9ACTN|nr:hypothetical protein [Streptomyces chattanoogensis]KPC67042.1 hypothetical protein ADL29_02395 [Streptomyces chattanoogensis]